MNTALSQYMALIILIHLFSKNLQKRSGSYLITIFTEIILCASAYMYFATNELPEKVHLITQVGQISGMLWLVLGSLAAFSLGRTSITYFASVLWCIQFVYMNWTLVFERTQEPYGLLLNSSMDCVLLLLLWPLAIFPNTKPKTLLFSLIPMSILILETRTSMGLVGLVTLLSGLMIMFFGCGGAIACAGLGVAGIITAMNTTIGSTYLDTSGRFEVWKQAMEWWWLQGMIWYGHGVGSYWGLGPFIQYLHGKTDPSGWFIFLHSDWLQVLFETGIIGLIIVFIIFIWLLRKALLRKRYFEAIALVVLASISIGDMPFRYGLSCLVCVMIVASIVSEQVITDPKILVSDMVDYLRKKAELDD